MHEAGHRTAFASRALNDSVAWWAGVLSFYNADFYRRYHQWHHRYTHLVGLDPELEDSPPTTRVAYLLELSGLPWWIGKVRGHLAGLRGDFSTRPYIPADAEPALRASLRRQFGVYGVLALVSLIGANGFLFWYWLLPLAVGQPLLRFVLLAEHGGCPFVADGLRNTRTTHTLAPLRRLMWNMPFHAEHHLYPSLPFHALAAAHHDLRPGLTEVAPGYLAVHRGFLANLAALAMPAAVAAGQSDAVPASPRS
jgi:fatty acid desaturase